MALCANSEEWCIIGLILRKEGPWNKKYILSLLISAVMKPKVGTL